MRRDSWASWLMREAADLVVAALLEREPRTLQVASPDPDDGFRVTVSPGLVVMVNRRPVGSGRAVLLAVERAVSFARECLAEARTGRPDAPGSPRG